MAHVYILQSKVNDRYYIGSTKNIKRRLEEHNSGKSTYTSFTKPFKLMLNQEYEDINQAQKIERKLKNFKNRKILKKIIQDGYIKIKP